LAESAERTRNLYDASRFRQFGFNVEWDQLIYLGVTGKIDKLEGAGGNQDMSSYVSAVVGLATPTNFDVFAEIEEAPAKNPIVAFLGKTYKQAPELWAFASPISHVTKSSPPLLLIQRESDRVVPFGQSLEIAERYGKAGARVEVVLFPDAPHGFMWFKKWFGETMDRAAAFFKTQLAKPCSPN